jgi:uncharacterized repeat protein (TIGR01451 family)
MKKIISLFRAFTVFSLFGILGFASTALATETVHIESKLLVANATRGDIEYKDTTTAKVDEVVKFEIWYHNTENPDSGKNATNLNVKINIPTTKTTTHTATSTVGGSNTNSVTDTATVTTQIPTTLSYIPGTAVRRHNVGTNAAPNWVTEKISDSVVSSGFTLPSMNPCNNFQESIYVQARVNASVISIVKNVKKEGSDKWLTEMEAKPGETLAFLITVKNEGNTNLSNVTVRDSFPPDLEFVKGSAKLFNVNYPNGFQLSDNIINGGANLGNYTPGSNAQVRLNAKVPTGCVKEDITHRNVGIVKSDQTGEFSNVAIVRVRCEKEVVPPPITPPVTPPETPVTTVSTAPVTLPVSGPAETATAVLALSSIGGTLATWKKTKNGLKKAIKK